MEALSVRIKAMAAEFDALRDELAAGNASPRELIAAAEDWEVLQRRHATFSHELLTILARDADPAELGGSSLKDLLVHRLRISSAGAGRRITDAEQLGPRRALTGQPLPPLLANTAAAQAEGRIGEEHIQIIYKTQQETARVDPTGSPTIKPNTPWPSSPAPWIPSNSRPPPTG